MAMQSFSNLLSGFPCAIRLSGIQRCARVVVAAAGLEVTQYTYATADGLYIAEKLSGQWALREERELRDTVRELAVLLGDSPLSTTQFSLTLSHEETACLLAMMDGCALLTLQAALGMQVSGGISGDDVQTLLRHPRENGALSLLYSLCQSLQSRIHADIALYGLCEKGLCQTANGVYTLNNELTLLAESLALPQSAISLCLWDGSSGYAAHVPSFAVQGTLHDILLVTVGLDEVSVSSLCADALLDVIEETLSCPGTEPDEWRCVCGKSNPNTGKYCSSCGRSRPVATTNAQTADAIPANAWRCACGRVNTGSFCPQCGAGRP